MDPRIAFDGLVLAGSGSLRFQGRDKALLELDGRSFLARSLVALKDARITVVVGPRRAGYEPDLWVQEHPPAGGPAAALGAGLDATDSDLVVVLAVDMPLVTGKHVHELVGALVANDAAGVALATQPQEPQLLAAAYRRERLREHLASAPALQGARLRDVLAGLPVEVIVSEGARDCDSPADLSEMQERLGR